MYMVKSVNKRGGGQTVKSAMPPLSIGGGAVDF